MTKMMNIAKDRYANYLIVGIDGEDIDWYASSKITGYGMACYLVKQLENFWDETEEKEED